MSEQSAHWQERPHPSYGQPFTLTHTSYHPNLPNHKTTVTESCLHLPCLALLPRAHLKAKTTCWCSGTNTRQSLTFPRAVDHISVSDLTALASFLWPVGTALLELIVYHLSLMISDTYPLQRFLHREDSELRKFPTRGKPPLRQGSTGHLSLLHAQDCGREPCSGLNRKQQHLAPDGY